MASSLSLIVVLCLTSGLWIGADANCNADCSVCPSGWTQHDCDCFKFFSAPLAWADAQVACHAEGANLASVNSMSEYYFVTNIIKESTGASTVTFLGGNDLHKEGKWMWADGSAFKFDAWSRGEPNNDETGEHCLALNQKDMGSDVSCISANPYICSKHV